MSILLTSNKQVLIRFQAPSKTRNVAYGKAENQLE